MERAMSDTPTPSTDYTGPTGVNPDMELITDLQRELAVLRAELEAVKAARDGWKASFQNEDTRYQKVCRACDHYIAQNAQLVDALNVAVHAMTWHNWNNHHIFTDRDSMEARAYETVVAAITATTKEP